MTVTTPESGFRARVQRLTRGTVVFAIALSAWSTGIGASGAMAAEGDAEDGAVELLVSAGASGTVAPGSSTTAAVTVRNDTTTNLSDGRVLVEIGHSPLSDETALAAWLDDGEATGDFDALGSETTEPIDAGGSGSTSIPVPQEALTALQPGVYPLRATLSDTTGGDADERASRDITATSVLVVSPASTTPVAVIVPITATPADGAALLGAEELAALTAADGALTAQLDGIAGTSAVIAIDPSIPAAIRVLGSAAPASAVEWLSRFDALPNERFALQFGDADAATQAQAGLPELLQPTTLANFLDPARFAAAPEGTPEPSSTPSPAPTAGPQLPDDAELRTVDGETTGILWPRGDVSAENLTTFAGYLGGEATTILPSTSVSGSRGGHATIGGHDVLIAHAAASAALSDAAGTVSAAGRQQALAEAVAHLYLSEQAAPAVPLLVALDRDDSRTEEALRDAIEAADSPGFGLSALRAAPATEAAVTSEPDTTRAAVLQSLLADETTLVSFSSILTDPQVLLSPERIELLRTIGVGPSDAEFDALVAADEAEAREILDAVAIPPSSTIQLLTANADLPFQVRNDLPWPVTVLLHVSPSDPRLDVQRVTEAVIPGNTNTRVKVPVSARVGSGEVDLRLSLTSSTGVPIGPNDVVRVAVRAEWETIGLVVFGSLIVILLGLGVYRTVRRKRQEADADGATAEETGEESHG
ncbi:pyruvate/2-oxoglutarate dehydrogenase complex, dihydrolipoamide acyltransferase (E2) component [Microbacterium sp. HM58-2]|nr:pyruvate/2-oxoglutarate dehydrogenase complex, dihydrolipoamide acyltransferase (E2) component [Microbacterium sp. HM58-2]